MSEPNIWLLKNDVQNRYFCGLKLNCENRYGIQSTDDLNEATIFTFDRYRIFFSQETYMSLAEREGYYWKRYSMSSDFDNADLFFIKSYQSRKHGNLLP